jgi:predicted AlkP superfamily pyrophosphatase or phosphodiesterase
MGDGADESQVTSLFYNLAKPPSHMHKTVVINVVGLTPRLIGANTPFIKQWSSEGVTTTVQPVLPAVTCPVQATYLTGRLPAGHGIVGNGWYFKEECEIKFWRQSNKLVRSPKIWEVARRQDPSFTCANMFWWYNMYSTADYSATPRPNYLADGRKVPDIYTVPAGWRDTLQKELGQFPLFNFWGPMASIVSSRWIADASILTDRKFNPTLTLIYLPHLDYNLQRHGHQHPGIASDLREIDELVKDLVTYYEAAGARVILLSEYGITDVSRPVHLNRRLRREGLLAIRREQTWELLDAGASQAFAVADHQVAHVYVNDREKMPLVRRLLEEMPGAELVLDKARQTAYQLDHDRSGDFVVVADADSWFTYYYWLDDDRAPDFARIVDIHRKPGYDPVEMFINPQLSLPKVQAAWKVLKKKLGFRMLMDLIPLDASLVRGSHGRLAEDRSDRPVFISCERVLHPDDQAPPDGVFSLILQHLQAH